MGWIIGRLGAYLWPIVGAAVLALVAWGGIQTARLHSAQQATVEVQSAWNLDRAQAQAAALAATNQNRAIEAQMQSTRDKADHDYRSATARNAAVLVAARADADRMRSELASFARGGGAAPDTVDACGSRAATLSELLDGALRTDAYHAAAAESASDAVRALMAAWPRD